MIFKDLEEYSDRQIENEYIRRIESVRMFRCSYCGNKLGKCNCKIHKQGGMAIGLYSDYCVNCSFRYED